MGGASPGLRSKTASRSSTSIGAPLELPLLANSDDFVFDNQILAQAVAARMRIGEISCPTSYHEEASSIEFARSCRYGLGVLATSMAFVAWRWGLATPRIFQSRPGDRLRLAEPGASAATAR